MANKLVIAEIAEKCGISTATVSRALSGRGYVSESKRRKIMEYVEDRGLRGERMRARSNGKTTALVVARWTALTEPMRALELRDLLEALHAEGYESTVAFGHRAESFSACLADRPRAVVVLNVNDRIMPHVARLMARGVVCVGTGECFEPACPVFGYDHADAVAVAVDRLRARGCRRLAYFAGMGEAERFEKPGDIAVCRHREIVAALAENIPGFNVSEDVVSDRFGSFSRVDEMLQAGGHDGWIIFESAFVNVFARLCRERGKAIPPVAAFVPTAQEPMETITDLVFLQPPPFAEIAGFLRNHAPEDLKPGRRLLPYTYIK